MTTFYSFVPSNVSPPTFNIILDNQSYSLVVTWNVSAQRYYINIYTLDGTWILTIPLSETAPSVPITDITFDSDQSYVIVTMSQPFWRKCGQIVKYTLENINPSSLNGTYNCITVNSTQFYFFQIANPGQIIYPGSVARYNNLVAGYFQSTLIFRNNQFETNP